MNEIVNPILLQNNCTLINRFSQNKIYTKIQEIKKDFDYIITLLLGIKEKKVILPEIPLQRILNT